MKRSGYADLPLHGGRVPPWLSERMTTLGSAIAENIIYNYGSGEFLSRLSDPFWFQAFGSVMGMDWHSSGITTSVVGALKRGLNPRAHELGMHVCGGRGKQSRKTPAELSAVANAARIRRRCVGAHQRLTAKIDNNAIADGFQLYLHTFIVSDAGEWAVVQQGMNPGNGLARRYHWHSATVRDFTCDPHTAIVGRASGHDYESGGCAAAVPAQKAMLEMVREEPQDTLTRSGEVDDAAAPRGAREGSGFEATRRCYWRWLMSANLRDFASLLLLENLGPRTLQVAGLDCGSGAWDAQPIFGSGTFFFCVGREGPASISCSVENL